MLQKRLSFCPFVPKKMATQSSPFNPLERRTSDVSARRLPSSLGITPEVQVAKKGGQIKNVGTADALVGPGRTQGTSGSPQPCAPLTIATHHPRLCCKHGCDQRHRMNVHEETKYMEEEVTDESKGDLNTLLPPLCPSKGVESTFKFVVAQVELDHAAVGVDFHASPS